MTPTTGFMDRLSALSELTPGWLDGLGLSVCSELVQLLASQWQEYAFMRLPTPFTYPTAEGGLLLEWDCYEKESLSLEFTPGRTVAQGSLGECWFELDFAKKDVWVILKGLLGCEFPQELTQPFCFEKHQEASALA